MCTDPSASRALTMSWFEAGFIFVSTSRAVSSWSLETRIQSFTQKRAMRARCPERRVSPWSQGRVAPACGPSGCFPRPVSLPAQRAGQPHRGRDARAAGRHARPPTAEGAQETHSASTAVLAFALTLSLQSQASKLIALLQSHTKSKVTAKLGNNLGFLWGSALPFICKTRTKKCRKFINTTHS